MSIIQIATRGTKPTKKCLPFRTNKQRKITEAQYFCGSKNRQNYYDKQKSFGVSSVEVK